MGAALQRAREQVAAAIARCSLRSIELDRRARQVLAEIEIADRTGRNHGRALALTSQIVMELERHQIEAAREERLHSVELFRGQS